MRKIHVITITRSFNNSSLMVCLPPIKNIAVNCSVFLIIQIFYRKTLKHDIKDSKDSSPELFNWSNFLYPCRKWGYKVPFKKYLLKIYQLVGSKFLYKPFLTCKIIHLTTRKFSLEHFYLFTENIYINSGISCSCIINRSACMCIQSDSFLIDKIPTYG